MRRLIGDAALERREECLSLNARHCWVDVWSLERQLTATEQTSRGSAPDAIGARIDRLLALYRGPFLADHREEIWVLSMRERLRSKLLRTIGLAATALTAANHHAPAIRYLEKVLEIDPLAENVHREIMQAHLAEGHHAEALSAYDRCRETLASQLGVAPSANTEAIRRRIPSC